MSTNDRHDKTIRMEEPHPLASVDAATAARVFSLWDKMTGVDQSNMDGGLKVLLQGLCDLLDTYTANALVAVRMSERKKSDPAQGWRPRHSVHLRMTPQIEDNLKEAKRRFKVDSKRDVTVIRNVASAGTWRANRLRDLAPPEWFDSPFYQRFCVSVGCRDALWVGCPINRDLELYVGLFRGPEKPWFQRDEGDVALLALRGLSWFLQRYVLSLGLGLGNAPLTRTERRVLRHLLKGDNQDIIADRLNQSRHTTHDHIKAIYRKFDVNSRAALSALWLGFRAS